MLIKDLIKTKIQFLKFDRWWVYKIGTGVFTLILFKSILNKNSKVIIEYSDIKLLLLLILLAIYGHLINDFSDYKSDKIVGKKNLFDFFPLKYASILLPFLISICLLFTFYFFSSTVLIFVIIQIFSSILYSLKPFRIKERGISSLIITGFYERLNPYLIILFFIAPSIFSLSFEVHLLSFFYLLWSYFWECRNFINGQLSDFENDQKSAVKSLILHKGFNKVTQLKKILIFVEIAMLITWLVLLVNYNSFYVYFLLLTIIFQLIQIYGSRQLYSKIENIFDNSYANIFMASFLIVIATLNQIDLKVALIILLLFQHKVIVDFLDFIYYRIRYVVTVSWSIFLGFIKNKNK